jgi:Asp-tRNA(Asn)/Glu-tRNA(Gln) amidotransferase A subunit family amidase
MTSIHAGPIAASAADMALVYQILAEPPPPDHYYYRLYGPGTGPPRPHLHGFGRPRPFLSAVEVGSIKAACLWKSNCVVPSRARG